jgi:dTDP-D-glucose 4,6-dehydratase
MKILVTGTSGFVGSHFVEVATEAGHIVKAWNSFMENDSLEETEALIHIASASEVAQSISDPVWFIKNNVMLTTKMLEVAREMPKLKHFIQISTAEVFGPIQDGSHDEYGPINPLNPYAASKCGQEAICGAYWRTYGVPTTIISTSNVFGERQRPAKFIPMVIKKILRNEVVTIHAEDEDNITTRSYIHAKSLSEGILWAVQPHTVIPYGPRERMRRLNIVGEHEMSNLALAKQIAIFLGRDMAYKLVKPERPGHDQRYSISGERARSSGFKPSTSFEQRLLDTVTWMVNHPSFLDV